MISAAVASPQPSAPKFNLVIGFASMLGLAFGCGVAALREHRDRVFRTGGQVRTIGVEYLGTLPKIVPQRLARKAIAHPQKAPESSREVCFANLTVRYAVDAPLSDFAEALRSTRIGIDLATENNSQKVVGFVSALPDEGKSTAAVNFALLLARSGARTLLIDADVRNPGLTRALAPDAATGLVEILVNGRTLQDVELRNSETGLCFVPTALTRPILHSGELLSSKSLKNFLTLCAAQFDYVVLDLPPLGPVVDARAIASEIDAFVMIVEWGKTPRSIVENCLLSDAQVREKCCGVLFNKAPLRLMQRYESYDSKEYYRRTYGNYYHHG